MIAVTLPIRAESVANLREHWRTKAARAKSHRAIAVTMLRAKAKPPAGAVTITMTRIAPRALDSHDNLRSAIKSASDGVADWLGLKDNDPRVTWVYAQEKGAPKTYAVRVEVA